MQSTRHPHPHLDPRQPRQDSHPQTNPPVFAWKAPPEAAPFELVVARDAGLRDVVLHQAGCLDPLFLPERALQPGRYYWTWRGRGCEGELFRFTVEPTAAVVEVPPVRDWLAALPAAHPRLYVTPEQAASLPGDPGLEAGRRQAADCAGELLGSSHDLAEPPYLPDRRQDYGAFIRAFGSIMWESRAFVAGAQALALAHLLTGREDFGRAACRRLDAIAHWDPEGSTHLAHNDEPHMSVIWNGPAACDWAWDCFTDDERERVIAQFRRRGEITFEHMHGRGAYGITRFDSHAGREIVFLALLSWVFHGHIPETERWLTWLRPVLCGIWPVWAGDDGAWAEGPSYGQAYVTIMQMFATALKRTTGVNLYRRPFWRAHGEWRRWCLPPYAEWIGFGDHTERWRSGWIANADLVEVIAREAPAPGLLPYVAQLRREACTCEPRPGVDAEALGITPQLLLTAPAPAAAGAAPATAAPEPCLRVFPAAGWAAFRTDFASPERDIAMIFRSSPFGSISHSHANHNDFVLHAGGRVLAMPSGYYDGYGSNHHANWVWHTRSHNCLTLSEAGQIMRSPAAVGRLETPWEDDRMAYVCGQADAAYADRARRCRRHVVFLKAERAFVMIDEFVGAPGMVSTPQWNLHAWAPFATDEAARAFVTRREGCALHGHVLYHHNGFFSLSEGWDPPPQARHPNPQWRPQYHLRFSPGGLFSSLNLAVVLCPDTPGAPATTVSAAAEGGLEAATIGCWRCRVRREGRGMDLDGAAQPELLAVFEDGTRRYALGANGMSPVG